MELEPTVLGSKELEENDSGTGGVSNAENLSLRFCFTLGGEAVAMF